MTITSSDLVWSFKRCGLLNILGNIGDMMRCPGRDTSSVKVQVEHWLDGLVEEGMKAEDCWDIGLGMY